MLVAQAADLPMQAYKSEPVVAAVYNSADSLRNSQNARVKGLTGARSVVIGRTRPFAFLFHRHSDAPSSGPPNEKQRVSAGAEVRTSSRRSGAQRYLLPAISVRWMPISQNVSSGPVFAGRAMPFPRIPCQDEEAFRFLLSLTCLASPCRAGDSRSRPQAAKRWRGTRQP